MESSFEVQYLPSLNTENRKSSGAEAVAKTFNVLILMFGFTCIAIGYALSHTPREELATFVGGTATSIQRFAPVGEASKTLLGLLG